jgi:hypothetical protein
LAIQKVQVDRNTESDPILENNLDLECDPKNRIGQKPVATASLDLGCNYVAQANYSNFAFDVLLQTEKVRNSSFSLPMQFKVTNVFVTEIDRH